MLHLGHAYSALLAFEAANRAGGRLLLRIEDIDRTRSRLEYEAALLEDLAWLGLRWEAPVLRQSEELPVYQEALRRLREEGLLYRCFRTRKEVLEVVSAAPHGPEAAFVGAPLPPDEEERRLEAEEPFAWRLSIEATRRRLGEDFDALSFAEEDLSGDGRRSVPVRPETVGDIILARKDVGVAYHLASVVDDARQGITHVVRGEDLRSAAPAHRILQAALGFPAPVYRHHPLLLDAEGRKLSKRAGSKSLRDFRREGLAPEALRAELLAGS